MSTQNLDDISTVDAQWLSSQLYMNNESSDTCKIFDCRTAQLFQTSHIKGAIHLNLTALILRRSEKGCVSLKSLIPDEKLRCDLEKSVSHLTVILYEENIDDSFSSLILSIYKTFVRFGFNVKLLRDSFSTFESQNSSICIYGDIDNSSVIPSSINISAGHLSVALGNCYINCSQPATPDSAIAMTPTTPGAVACPVPILDYLYLGSAKDAESKDVLAEYGITYVLNMTPKVDTTFKDENSDICYLVIPVKDNSSADIHSVFSQAFDFIEEGIGKKTGVLVHCLAGVSRSVTIVLAYLMQAHSMSLEEAFDFVKERKGNIQPNFFFMDQLKDFERCLAGKRS